MLVITFWWIWHRRRRRSFSFIRHSKIKLFLKIFEMFFRSQLWKVHVSCSCYVPLRFRPPPRPRPRPRPPRLPPLPRLPPCGRSSGFDGHATGTILFARWNGKRNSKKLKFVKLNLDKKNHVILKVPSYLDLYPTKTLVVANNHFPHYISLFESHPSINLPRHHYFLRIFLQSSQQFRE